MVSVMPCTAKKDEAHRPQDREVTKGSDGKTVGR